MTRDDVACPLCGEVFSSRAAHVMHRGYQRCLNPALAGLKPYVSDDGTYLAWTLPPRPDDGQTHD